jgi:hypothetical protein
MIFFGLGVGRQMYVVVYHVCSFFENITLMCCVALSQVSGPCEKKAIINFSVVSYALRKSILNVGASYLHLFSPAKERNGANLRPCSSGLLFDDMKYQANITVTVKSQVSSP